MIGLILICMGMSYVHRLMNDQDSTWMSQVSGFRKELLPSLPKAQPTQSLGESPAPCLLVSWSELAPLRPQDFELILQGPWGIDLIPCLLSLHGWLWITPRELQLRSLHWTSCLLHSEYWFNDLTEWPMLLASQHLPKNLARHTFIFQKRKKLKMEGSICKHVQTGFCKFDDQCQKQHVLETCENIKCVQKLCRKIHPKACKFFTAQQKCKFNDDCAYKHVISKEKSDISLLRNKLPSLKETKNNMRTNTKMSNWG